MKLKKWKTSLKWLLKTWHSNHTFVALYKDLNALYYRNAVTVRLLTGNILAVSTMKGGVELRTCGERYYLRCDQFNNEIYVQREDVGTKEWDNLNLWDPGAEAALSALVSLIRHNPYVPSEEGVRYVG